MKPLLLLGFVLALFSGQYNAQIDQIDVSHYKIDITVSDDSDTIKVLETIRFQHIDPSEPILFNLASVQKDGKGMVVQELLLNQTKAHFLHRNDSLKIDWRKEESNHTFELIILFKGIPIDGLVIGQNKYGSRTFFGDNWPTRAQNWFACNDHLSDKATVDFMVTAPKKYDVVANGSLLSVIKEKHTKTHHYSSSIPLPTKVMVVGIAEMYSEEAGVINGTTVNSYVYPNNNKKAAYDLALAPSILAFYIDYIAPYEFEKLDNVQSTTRFGGMENAGCIFYDENALKGSRSSENLIAHEIVHQWFGNSATEKDWSHLWLSEGFATYLTNVYIEQTKGTEAFQTQLRKDRIRVLAFEKKYKHPVIDTSYTSLMNLLNPNSYQKGAWVLHMLRTEIGDSLFHLSIQKYYQTYRLSNANSKDFQKIVENICRRDLNWFFEQWLYNAGHPKLKITSKIDGQILTLKITQQTSLFSFPLKVAIEFESGAMINEVINISKKNTLLEFYREHESIKSFELDPEVQLLFEVLD